MTKTKLPALLRNGYSATAFYQSHGIDTKGSDGFDVDAVLPENANLSQQGKKTKLYVNNQLIGCFEPGAYKVRFDSVKAVAIPKKPNSIDIAEGVKVEKAARPQKTTVVSVVSLPPVVVDALKIAEPEKQKPAPKESKPKATKPEKKAPKPKAPINRPEGYVAKEPQKAIFDKEDEIATLINSGTPKYQIAKRLGVSISRLSKYINDKGIVTPYSMDARRKRDIDLSKEKWTTLAMQYGANIQAIAKHAKCSRSTAYARLNEYVPIELWQKPAKSRKNPISSSCDFWLSIHKNHNGNFETIAIELQCKVSSAKTYYYKSGASKIITAENAAMPKPPKPRRVYTPKKNRKKRPQTELKEKSLWERLSQEHGTVKKIATAIGKSIYTCYAYLNKYLPNGDWKKQKPDMKTNKDFWLSMYKKHGDDWEGIANELGYTVLTARQYFRNSGAAAELAQKAAEEKQQRLKEEEGERLNFIDQRQAPTRRLEADAPKIISMMNNGSTITAIRKAYKTHYDTVNAFLQRPEIASQIHYVAPKGAASYELRLLHPKEKIVAATSQTKVIKKLSDMLGLDKRTVKALMIAYDIPFKK
jgi:DNA invertase Pin-like site-specific DNA recombinase